MKILFDGRNLLINRMDIEALEGGRMTNTRRKQAMIKIKPIIIHCQGLDGRMTADKSVEIAQRKLKTQIEINDEIWWLSKRGTELYMLIHSGIKWEKKKKPISPEEACILERAFESKGISMRLFSKFAQCGDF